MTEMVPNPLLPALQETLRTIEPLIHDMQQALVNRAKDFHSGRIWTGPVAKDFDGELDRHTGRVRYAGDTILNELRLQITRTADMVTEKEAQRLIRQYDL
ncbi:MULTISPECIES: hypothetical protein [Nonomuraea]|uniref:Uncharacterized protein n=1 Tax=Nonomuraea jabiensis TaxID=882448 RepID=A0A7W9G0L7_9ACTN|nr:MULTISPECIES: hypothetical protein [Nonomuraea]MBB5775025.1 hypothetical protein [Nonomuraea jabiensis]MDX3108773.1 hypothetical protein [Nonomuraea angiospora]